MRLAPRLGPGWPGLLAAVCLAACAAPTAGVSTIGLASVAIDPVATAASPEASAPLAASPAAGSGAGAASPAPAASGPGASGGGGAIARVTLAGRVVHLETGAPIAGALVEAVGHDGPITALTDAEGGFSLSGRGLPREVAAEAAGFVTRVTAGWTASEVTVRLRPIAPAPVPLADLSALPLSGSVVDAQGAPVAGARVVGADGRGGSFGPVETDPAGRFSGLASVPEDFAPDGMALVAFAEATDQLAYRRAVPDAAGAVGALVAASATGRVSLAPGWVPGETDAAIAAVVADGPRLTLGAWRFGQPGGIGAPYFEVPGVALEAQASSTTATAASAWHAIVSGPGALTPALLPQLGGLSAIARGRPLSWSAVPGAEGYALSLRAGPAGELRWEALATGPRVTLLRLPEGPGELELAATAGTALRATTRARVE